MYKLLFDSDSLIKISKAEFLDVVAENFNVFITEEIYSETVQEGKKRLYQDADKIENLIKQDKIKIINKGYYKNKKEPQQIFGKGEVSVYQAYKKGILIVTDDLSFTTYILGEQIECVSSAHLLVVLVKKGKLEKDMAYSCLEKLKPFIREDAYELVKRDIKGE